MSSTPRTRGRSRVKYPAALVLVASATAAGVYLLAPGSATRSTDAKAASAPAAPTAREFAHNLVGTTNAYAAASGDKTRIANANCVQASRGHYMCSYAARKPGTPAQCHIMQGRWTPRATSTITVTLAGRAERCGSLRAALSSLT